MTIYYVSEQGSDAHNGLSKQTPYRHIQKAVDKIYPGDTIQIKGGNYKEVNLNNIKGTKTNYINIIGYDGQPWINEADWKGIGLKTSDTSYLNIDNLNIKNVNNPFYFSQSDTHHINYKNSEFCNYVNPPSISYNAHDILMDTCHIHTLASGSNNLFNVMGNATKVTHDITFHKCVMHDTKVHGTLNLGHYSNAPHERLIVDSCHFYDNTGGGHISTNATSVNNSRFVNNLFETCRYGGLRINASNTYFGHNTIKTIGYVKSDGTKKGSAPLSIEYPGIPWIKCFGNTFEYNHVENCIGASKGYGGVSLYASNNDTLRSNTQNGQACTYLIKNGTHIIYDPYDQDTINLNKATIYIRCTNKEHFSVRARGSSITIHYITQHQSYSEIRVDTTGSATITINRSETPPTPSPTPYVPPTPIPTPTPTPNTGTINCTCNVQALISTDGHLSAYTPCTFTNLAPGTHSFNFTKKGYNSITYVAIIQSGITRTIHVDLKLLQTYPIIFNSVPTYANIKKV